MKLVLLSVLIISNLALFSQSSALKRADKHFQAYSYEGAINIYSKIKEKNSFINRRLGKSYYYTGDYMNAEAYFSLVAQSEKPTSEDYYNYAFILRMNKKYVKAQKWMQKFNEINKVDNRGKLHLLSPDYYNLLLKHTEKYSVFNLDINTEESDFGTSYFNNKIVFASSREKDKPIIRRWIQNNMPFLDIYSASLGNNLQLRSIKRFKGRFNTKFHDGPAAFSKTGKFMLFTRNNIGSKSSNSVVKLKLFSSTLNNKKWTKPEEFAYNDDEYSVGHATLSHDGKKVYFASDMPGGIGGVDLYYCNRREDGSWDNPVNLGKMINTEGDEMFPFIHENGLLYFASNGLPGLGGLDIYVYNMNKQGNRSAENLGAPVNSSYDDFAFIINTSMTNGYFSSNRLGGKGSDDIYAFAIKKSPVFNIYCRVTDAKTSETIEGVAVSFLNKSTGLTEEIITAEQGDFKRRLYGYNLLDIASFTLIFEKEGYRTDTANHSVRLIKEGEYHFFAQLEMPGVVRDLEREEFDYEKWNVGKDGTIVLNPIYFDLDKWNIRRDAAIELDKVVKIMNAYPTIEVESSSHTDCRASAKYNMRLSQKRAESAVAYIKARIVFPERISGKGYGESQLINDCKCEGNVTSKCTDQEHQMNRRTEFVIVLRR